MQKHWHHHYIYCFLEGCSFKNNYLCLFPILLGTSILHCYLEGRWLLSFLRFAFPCALSVAQWSVLQDPDLPFSSLRDRSIFQTMLSAVGSDLVLFFPLLLNKETGIYLILSHQSLDMGSASCQEPPFCEIWLSVLKGYQNVYFSKYSH